MAGQPAHHQPLRRRPDPAQLVSECWTNGTTCESCGAARASVVLRTTTHGVACLVMCQRCQTAPEPIHQSSDFTVTDHAGHVDRARSAGEIT